MGRIDALRTSVDAWLALVNEARVAPRTATITCFGVDEDARRALVAAVSLSALVQQDGSPLVDGSVLVAPPVQDTRVFDGMDGANERAAPPTLREAVRERATIVRSESLEAAALENVLRQIPNGSSVYVMDASRYASRGEATYRGRTAWVGRLAALYRGLLPLVRAGDLMMILDAGEYWPADASDQKELNELEDVSVHGGRPEDRVAPADLDRWTRMFADSAEEVVEPIIAAIIPDRDAREIVIGTALARAGKRGRGWRRLAPYAADVSTRPTELAVVWANWAFHAGDRPAAEKLLEYAASRASRLDEPTLAGALDLAHALQSPRSLVERIANEVARLFPASLTPDRIMMRHALAKGEYQPSRAAAERVLAYAPDDPEAAFYSRMAVALPSDEHRRVVREFSDDKGLAPRALEIATGDLLDHGRVTMALALLDENAVGHALTPSAIRAERTAIEASLLASPPPTQEVTWGLVDRFVHRALSVLGNDPANGYLRLDVAELLAPETCGTTGLTVLAAIVLGAPPPHVAPAMPAEEGPDESDDASMEAIGYAKAVFSATERHGRLGETTRRVPLGTRPAATVATLVAALRHVAFGNRQDDVEFDELSTSLHVALAAAREHGEPLDYDVRVLRLATCGTAVVGTMQRARDLAEECLRSAAGGSPHRRRLAWTAFADAYHRLRDPARATLALACALGIDAPLTPEEAGEEYALRLRLLRDAGMTVDARAVLRQARDVFARADLSTELHRFDHFELQIRLLELLRSDSDTALDGIARLGDDVAAFLDNRVAEEDFELAPPVVLLAEIMGHLRRAGRAVSPRLAAAFTAGETVIGEQMRRRIQLLSGALSTDAQLQEAAALLTETRDVADRSTDVGSLVIVARRALGEAVSNSDRGRAAVAIELLADHTVASEVVPAIPGSSAVVIAAMNEVNELGGDLHMLAVDAQGRVIRVGQVKGCISGPSVESGFDLVRLDGWARRYPQSFGRRDDSGSGFAAYAAFADAMQPFKLKIRPPERTTLVVADPRLSRVAPALCRVAGGILGVAAPVASVPSLSWLKASAANATRLRAGGRVAWVPRSEAGSAALDDLAARIAGSRATSQIPIFRGTSPPLELANADIAIVGIHGGVRDWRRGGIARDDAGAGRWERDVARASGARIVVLLICHGGYVTAHPFGHAQLGLARQCLHEGAACVIAPLWALRVGTASLWLGEFLHRLRLDPDAADACFATARSVRSVLPHPADWLAMHVYGNPFVHGVGTARR